MATSSAGTGETAVDAPGDLGADLASAALTLARRFAAGATMWCVAPVWAEHARHVAVEFVHPVIVGKRALPAVSIDVSDPVGELRAFARTGDVLVVIGDAATPAAPGTLCRAAAWGLSTLWIGAGPRPVTGAADHVLWDETADAGPARHDGSVVRLYHVLWELTHVCFEHPGLLTAATDECEGEACITCTDEGRPGEVQTVDEHGMASVRTSRGVERVDTTLLAAVAAGDVVVVHAGVAIAVLEDSPRE
jgi:hydrogenase maturation factor